MTFTKEELDAAVVEAVEKATKGLKEKNAELLGDLKKEKDVRKELDEAKRIAEEEAANKSGDVEKIKTALEAKHKKELEALAEKNAKADQRLNQVLIDNGLTDALIQAKIAPQHMKAVKALIKSTSKAEIVDQDGSPVATIDGKAIGEFVKGWSLGDEGKYYVAAPDNGGGSSKGGDGKDVTAKTITRTEFNTKAPADQMAFVKEGGKLTD